MKNHYKLLIIGAGTGGITIAARMRHHLAAGEIAILDSSKVHHYQPIWTLVGAGLVDKDNYKKDTSTLIPDGVDWIQSLVSSVDATAKKVKTTDGNEITYDWLIVATGLKLDFNKVKGLDGNLGKNGIHTIYQYDQVDATYQALNNFKGGTALFIMPPPPIKCAGAPQKIMYLADEIFRKNGVREKSKIIFASAGMAIFGVPTFTQALQPVLKRKEIETRFRHKIVEVDATNKIAKFDVFVDEKQADGTVKTLTQKDDIKYDFLHIVPPQSAHQWVTDSGLAFTEGAADQVGWLKVDKFTLQHQTYSNIFGIGDVTGVPNSKTGAAIRKMAPVVEQNLLAAMAGTALPAKYDGYSSCPLVTSSHSVILAEFGYDGKLLPTFPLDPTKERYSYWILKRYLLPIMYWHGMLKGRA